MSELHDARAWEILEKLIAERRSVTPEEQERNAKASAAMVASAIQRTCPRCDRRSVAGYGRSKCRHCGEPTNFIRPAKPVSTKIR